MARNSLYDKPVALEFRIILEFRSRVENQRQTCPTDNPETGNQTRITLVGGEWSYHCAILAPSSSMIKLFQPTCRATFRSFSHFCQHTSGKKDNINQVKPHNAERSEKSFWGLTCSCLALGQTLFVHLAAQRCVLERRFSVWRLARAYVGLWRNNMVWILTEPTVYGRIQPFHDICLKL